MGFLLRVAFRLFLCNCYRSHFNFAASLLLEMLILLHGFHEMQLAISFFFLTTEEPTTTFSKVSGLSLLLGENCLKSV